MIQQNRYQSIAGAIVWCDCAKALQNKALFNEVVQYVMGSRFKHVEDVCEQCDCSEGKLWLEGMGTCMR